MLDAPSGSQYDDIIQNHLEEAMRRYALIFAVTLAAVLMLAGCGPDVSGVSEPNAPSETAVTADVSPKPGFDVGNVMPDFSVPLAGGGTFTLSENLGKPVFINLYATWCGPCVAEMPEIDRLYNEFGDQVNFLVIDVGEDEQTALDFAEQNGYSLPFAYSLDGMPFGFAYRIDSIPRTFVLDADGVISAYYLGMRDYDTFKAAIKAALAH